MAGKRSKGVDPTWPELPEGEHPVTELSTDLQGALWWKPGFSPLGDMAVGGGSDWCHCTGSKVRCSA